MLGLFHVTLSSGTLQYLDFLIRKLAHLSEYAIFAAFLYHALSGEQLEWRPSRALVAVLLAGLYSLTDEYHQIFVPGRTPSLVDSGIDTTGAMVGTLLFYLSQRYSRAKNPQPSLTSD